MKRKSLSKRLRFAVFTRDEFTCRYCGQCPPTVKLVIDHVIPVAGGGTDDESNLITSCENCNQGKSDKPLGTAAPTDGDTRRMAQEHLEQVSLAEVAARAAKAREDLRKVIAGFWLNLVNDEIAVADMSRLCTLAMEFSPDQVFEWLEIAYGKTRHSWDIVKYINGIARNVREQANQEQEA